MMRPVLLVLVSLVVGSCTVTKPLDFRVSPMGDPVEGNPREYIYGLPETLLKIEVEFVEIQHIPGPYREYAERYLGIGDIIRQRTSQWEITGIQVHAFEEPDPEQYYVLRVDEGEFDASLLEPFLRSRRIFSGSEKVHENLEQPGRTGAGSQAQSGFVDLGIESNFAERSETMFKTIVTDTSFVEVPVQRTVVEQKSPSRKAEEAAEFLLELRTRRFEMLTGEYEVFPDGEAMEAAIRKLDQLESSYLTLFTGKTIYRKGKRAFFLDPASGSSPGRYRLGMFSGNLGFLPEALMEGEALEVLLNPLRKTQLPERHFPGNLQRSGLLYYRIPDVVEMRIILGDELLGTHRISILQSGTLVGTPLR